MKAGQIKEFGDASIINIVEIDKPTIGDGQVLVEVHASSINPFDVAILSGRIPGLRPPFTLGDDIAGVVSEIGAGVDSFKVGDKVYGRSLIVTGGSGAYAEYAATVPDQLAKIPRNLSFKEAASLPLAGVSALQGIIEHIKLTAGQKILITGGSGGIGTIAIQIAKHLGAHVATTASGDGLELVKQLGADEVFDYKSQDATQLLNGADAVFDTVSAESVNKALKVLKKGGIAVSMLVQPDETTASELGVTAMREGTELNTARLDKLRELVESGIVKPVIGRVYPLDQIQAAFKAKTGEHINGKIVINIKI